MLRVVRVGMIACGRTACHDVSEGWIPHCVQQNTQHLIARASSATGSDRHRNDGQEMWASYSASTASGMFDDVDLDLPGHSLHMPKLFGKL